MIELTLEEKLDCILQAFYRTSVRVLENYDTRWGPINKRAWLEQQWQEFKNTHKPTTIRELTELRIIFDGKVIEKEVKEASRQRAMRPMMASRSRKRYIGEPLKEPEHKKIHDLVLEFQQETQSLMASTKGLKRCLRSKLLWQSERLVPNSRIESNFFETP
jgi:hypothetical protein